MQLTKQDKENLQGLIKHAGFKVLEAIVEEKRNQLFTTFENLPLADPKVLEQLSGTQNFNKGMKYLIDTAKSKTQAVAKAKDMS